ncbi:MAG TPA: hypothetical protein VG406_18430 [Isosphaeraceae bacterium]|jgi:hypothetical protein|nr:hypothetical protein [Isosphaeraceae bacterium]
MSSNLKEVLAGLDGLRSLGDLDRDGLGEALLDAASAGVKATAEAGTDPDGAPWPRLSPAYAAAKAASHPGRPIGVRDGVMLSDGALRGERDIGPRRAEVTFGDSAEARDELGWFAEGDLGHDRPPRPVVGLSPAAIAAADRVVDQHVNRKV